MFIFAAILCIIFGLSLLLKAHTKIKEQKTGFPLAILGIGGIVSGTVMIYSVLSGEIRLPIR